MIVAVAATGSNANGKVKAEPPFGNLPSVVLTENTTVAIQTVIDTAPATGLHIIYPPSLGVYQPTNRLVFRGKRNVVLDGIGFARWVTHQVDFPFVALLGTNENIQFRGIDLRNTLSRSGPVPVALLHGYEQGPNRGISLDHCTFSCPGVAQNAITFTPYSPRAEKGNGRGSLLENLTVHHCHGHDIGRMFLEITSHVHADGSDAVYVKNTRFTDNRVERTGLQDEHAGMAASVSGMNDGTVYARNSLTDCQYAGLELVSAQNAVSQDNRFYTTSEKARYSAYSISRAGSNRNRNIAISGDVGVVPGRPFILYDCDGFTISKVNFQSDAYTDIRASRGTLRNSRLKVMQGGGTGFAGGNVIQLNGVRGVNILNNRLELRKSPQKQYSVISLGVANSNTNCVISGNVLIRPGDSADSFIHRDTADTNKVLNNVEIKTS